MFSEKNKLLLDTYQRFIDIVLGLCEPDTLENIMLSDAMGFGTTTDEKIFGVEAFLKILKFQNEQSKGLDFKWKVEPVSRYISLSEDLAAFADDIYLNFEVNGEKIEMYLRTSIILEYRDDKWLVIHWHGSKPEEVQSEEDTFGIETWKQKVETLEKQVAERTADLVEKNKELEVEASLERVRSVAMSMQKSTELADTASILFQQIKEFGFETWSCGFCIWKEDDIVEVWMGADSSGLLPPMKIPYIEEPTHHDIYNASLTGADSHEKIWEGGALEEHYNFLRKVPSVAVAIKQLDEAGLSLPTKQCYYVGFFKQGYLLLITKEPNAEIREICKKFSNVFEQSYTRFLDLQKAEKQAREAEIELALERVRARTMAMQHSDELLDAATLLFQQIEFLGAPTWNCSFNIWDKDRKHATAWNGTKEGFGRPFKSNSSENVYLDFYKGGQNGEKLFIKEIGGKVLENHYKYMSTVPGVSETLAELKAAGVQLPTFQIFYIAYFDQGYLMFITYEPVPEFQEIFKRFAKVFEQTYTRFLDLQKAEVQAREAKIEAAVERVRAEAMAMHSTSDFEIVVKQLLQQIQHLNLEGFTGAQIILIDEKEFLTVWDCSSPGNMGDPKSATIKYEAKKFPIMGVEILNKWKEGNPYFVMDFDLKKLRAAVKEWKKINETIAGIITDAISGGHLTHQWDACGRLKNGMIAFDMIKPPDDDVRNITIKMTHAFEQAYTRFLDLQKAEAQAREAQIEAALEKVRSTSLAMHKSDELKDVILEVLKKLQDLGIAMESRATAIFTYEKESKDYYQWVASPEYKTIINFLTPYIDHPVQNDIWKARQTGTDFYAKSYTVQEKNSLFRYFFELPALKNMPQAEKEKALGYKYYDVAIAFEKNSAVVLVSHSGKQLTESESAILRRFAKVFEQSYIRFLDLQKAEAQAREAEIELALERVRARTMAMLHSDELADASFLLDQQVRALGIKTWGCAFNIYGENDSTEWFSNEMGTLQTYKTPREKIFLDYYEAGQKGEKLLIKEFAGKDCVDWYNYLCTLPVIGDGLLQMKAAGGSFPTRQIDHVAFFKYGYLLFISFEPVSETHEIFIRFAQVFEQTYTRFLDLQKAEVQALRAEQDVLEIKEARKKAEQALSILQATQKQLIQSEKMASLGELTAGIAHEIQNPLNFVNNFSEVSKELLDEMKTELDNGNTEDAKEIADDIIQNLEKINHHGKRADAIVKGMLQHSRSSNGVKEPTDINALCDEYLRLSYHGLRAKDKSFNASMKTDFDSSIGNINIIPQDIGRVILNLLTNAFYAVNEKKKSGLENYDPTVSIATKKEDDKTIISIKDNGNGIPQSALDKIFQPFFTTKPTGQGTGLGLSLAYDIITKGHGGELYVDTKETEGTSFTIKI